MKVALVTNIPAPYRIPVLNRVAGVLGDDFLALFCARTEPDRQWDLEPPAFRHAYLEENFMGSCGTYIHNNPDVVGHLRRFRPDVVITTGFNPTHLYAWCYSLLPGRAHVSMTDGWIGSERSLGAAHRVVRRIVYRTSQAFLGPGRKSLEMYQSYGVADADIFRSPLCIQNDRFSRAAGSSPRTYDVMFSGRIIEGKMPYFFAEVAGRVKEARGGVRALVIGDGPLREGMLAKLAGAGVEVDFAGFVPHAELPGFYCRAKVLLFATGKDAWGIVANEALASGTPVITTPYSGAAGDLVVDGWNGYVIGPDAAAWSEKVVDLLENASRWEEMHLHAFDSVNGFTFDAAAEGIVAAARWAFSRP